MNDKKSLLIIVTSIVVALLFIGVGYLLNDKRTVQFGADYDFLLANNPYEWRRGLSGKTTETMDALGMLFVFPRERERSFWMNGMNFDLDIIWIKDGKIMKIDRNVPAPKDGEEPKVVNSAPFEVNRVLELPAGGADYLKLFVGQVYEDLE
jgi:uncharacterized membrane protein (UPF0127 family)